MTASEPAPNETDPSAATPREPPTKGKRILGVGLWVLIVLEWVAMGAAGLSKFQGDAWIQMFEGWGYAGWFALLIGGAEVTLATLLLIPRLTSYVAVPLIVIMVGAIYTVLTNESQTGPGMPAIHITVLAILMWARWSKRWGASD